MQKLSVLLDRFRRTAGVPAAVGDELEAELAPVFSALEEIEADASRVHEDATADAARRLNEAETASSRIAAGWRELAERARARVTAQVRRAAEQEAREILAVSRREADRVRAHGRERMPELVDAVLACVRRSGE